MMSIGRAIDTMTVTGHTHTSNKK